MATTRIFDREQEDTAPSNKLFNERQLKSERSANDDNLRGKRLKDENSDIDLRNYRHSDEGQLSRTKTELQQVPASLLVEKLGDELKVMLKESQMATVKETKEVVLSSFDDRREIDTEELNSVTVKLNKMMNDFKTLVDSDSVRLREEECRLIKLQV